VDYLEYFDVIKKKYNLTDGKRNIFIIGTPNHGNMGDHAIWYATQRLMEDFFYDSNVVDIDIGDFWEDIGAIASLIKESDIIILQGGGNLGNRYMDDELIRRCTVIYFPNNRLIMFPQTIYFSDDENGRTELKKSIQIYEKNKNLVLIARDTYSYKVMRENFTNDIFVLQDVALTLNYVDKNKETEDILFCFRNDAEGIIRREEIREMEEFLVQRGNVVRYTDTQVEKYAKKDREWMLNRKIEEFQSASMVVTDRLHGMIFSVITGTPCIVFDNYNSKIKNAYLDLKDMDYIIMVSQKDEFITSYELLMNKKSGIYDEKPVIECFSKLLKKIFKQSAQSAAKEDFYQNYQNYMNILGNWSMKVMTLQVQSKEKTNELVIYKDWVDNLKKQNEELSEALNEMKSKEKQWNIQQRELYKCIKYEREKNKK